MHYIYDHWTGWVDNGHGLEPPLLIHIQGHKTNRCDVEFSHLQIYLLYPFSYSLRNTRQWRQRHFRPRKRSWCLTSIWRIMMMSVPVAREFIKLRHIYTCRLEQLFALFYCYIVVWNTTDLSPFHCYALRIQFLCVLQSLVIVTLVTTPNYIILVIFAIDMTVVARVTPSRVSPKWI